MKTKSLLQAALRGGIASLAITLLALGSPAQAASPKALQFTSSVVNTAGSTMTLDHPLLNGKPKLNLILTQRLGPGVVYNNHPVGVQYDPANGRWQIRNEDVAAIPAGACFNVLIPASSKRVGTTVDSVWDNVTTFTYQFNKPNALLLATHIVNPVLNFPGNLLPRNIGTYYTGTGSTYPLYYNKWSVYTEDGGDLPVVGFNIADVSKTKIGGVANSFVFTTTAGNTSANQGIINNSVTNDKPNAVVFVTHVYGFGSSTYQDTPLGVWYSGGTWRIFTQDTSAMPANRAFVVSSYPLTP
jgi:hypothetical protein